MKIQTGIESTTFGYNKQLNKEFIGCIKKTKDDQEFMNVILKMNALANLSEDRIRFAEKVNDNNTVTQMTDALLYLKSYVASIANDLFPKLKYIDKEIKSYQKDLANKGVFTRDHWIKLVIDELKDILVVDKCCKTGEIKNIEDYMAARFGSKSSKVDGIINAVKNSEVAQKPQMTPKEKSELAKKAEKLVKEYVPTDDAKKGFAGLGGMKDLKELLEDRIVTALKDPQQAKLDEIEYGKKVPKGILLYGPPGCGKTTIIEHLSTEAGVPLLKVESGSIGSEYIHKTSRNIDTVFDYAEERAKDKPVLVFIDDGESLLGARHGGENGGSHTEEVGSFLNRIQKAGENNVMVVVATNKYDLLDEAIRSRFEEQILVNLPDKEARKSVVKMFMDSRSKGKNLASDEKSLDKIADLTDKFSIRTIKMMADKASLLALKDNRRDISAGDWEKVIKESEKMKVKSDKYVSDSERKRVGFVKS